MSTPPNTTHKTSAQPTTIRVVSHSPLIYWWPVWLVGLFLAGLTYAEGTRLAVLPPCTKVKAVQSSSVYELNLGSQASSSLESAAANTAKGQDAFPTRIA